LGANFIAIISLNSSCPNLVRSEERNDFLIIA
jgi:hypothetical protein